jgi:autotransporter-associated beta strand protein
MFAFVRPWLLLIVWTVGVGFAGEVFGAEGRARNKAAAPDVPRELAMRPLPTYRIEPPDILQIEVTTAKGTPISGVSTMTPGSFGYGIMTTTDSGTMTKTNSGTMTKTNSGTMTKTGSGTLVLSGNNTYTTTVKVGKPGQSSSQATVKSGGPAANTPPGQTVAAVKKPSGPTANPPAKPSKQIHVNIGKTESKTV